MLGRWGEQWGMEFNTDKCQIVGFNRQDSVVNCTYFLNGKPLEQVSSFEYFLGINVSNNFDWDVHIDSVTAKVSQRLGMIKHVLFDVPRKVKRRVAYLTLCRPILENASEVW